ncbi:MAG: hypothetical protein ACSNEK_09935 [Parachlamydiaceae bacterium]
MNFNTFNISYTDIVKQVITIESQSNNKGNEKDKKVKFNFLKSPRKQEIPSTFLRQKSLTQLPLVPPLNIPRCIAPENDGVATVNHTIFINDVTVFQAGEQDDQFNVFSKLLFKIYQCGFAKDNFRQGFNLSSESRSLPIEISDQVHILRKLTLEDKKSREFQKLIKKSLAKHTILHWAKIKELFDAHIASMTIKLAVGQRSHESL